MFFETLFKLNIDTSVINRFAGLTIYVAEQQTYHNTQLVSVFRK